MKALPGTSYDGQRWYVAIMHLPTLKTIFPKLTVDPAAIAAYPILLRRMLQDLQDYERHKGVKELFAKHAAGIAVVRKQALQPVLL